MQVQTIINIKNNQATHQVDLTPKDLSELVEKFSRAYYVNRKDFGTVTVRLLIKDIIKSDATIQLHSESIIQFEEFEDYPGAVS